MSNTETNQLAAGLSREFGKKRGSAVAWEMYNASALSRGELYRVLRLIKNL